MKKKIILFSLLSLISLFIYFSYGWFSNTSKFLQKLEDMDKIEKNSKRNRIFKDNIVAYSLNTNDSIKVPILDNRIKFLHYWATWCKPCVSELSYFNKNVSNFENIDFIFTSKEEKTKLDNFFKKKVYNHLSFYKYKYSDSIKMLPHTIIIKNDSVIGEYVGTQDWTEILTKLNNYE
jgi:thiol-disulfide isomerase/thioredoxin